MALRSLGKTSFGFSAQLLARYALRLAGHSDVTASTGTAARKAWPVELGRPTGVDVNIWS
jgi:hypothetical protein